MKSSLSDHGGAPHLFAIDFVARSKDGNEKLACRIEIDHPERMPAPFSIYRGHISLSGPEPFSMEMKGAHPLQFLEMALFTIRTVLASEARYWSYEDLSGEKLDFSYKGPEAADD
jgi:hypothetical protein